MCLSLLKRSFCKPICEGQAMGGGECVQPGWHSLACNAAKPRSGHRGLQGACCIHTVHGLAKLCRASSSPASLRSQRSLSPCPSGLWPMPSWVWFISICFFFFRNAFLPQSWHCSRGLLTGFQQGRLHQEGSGEKLQRTLWECYEGTPGRPALHTT
jgi:hypothetical protein